MSDVLKSGVLHARRVEAWSSTCQTCWSLEFYMSDVLKPGVIHVRRVEVWSSTCQTC